MGRRSKHRASSLVAQMRCEGDDRTVFATHDSNTYPSPSTSGHTSGGIHVKTQSPPTDCPRNSVPSSSSTAARASLQATRNTCPLNTRNTRREHHHAPSSSVICGTSPPLLSFPFFLGPLSAPHPLASPTETWGTAHLPISELLISLSRHWIQPGSARQRSTPPPLPARHTL
jgi:hypothetical protein